MTIELHASGKTNRPDRRCSQNVIAASEKFARQAFARSNRAHLTLTSDVSGFLEWGYPKIRSDFFSPR
jgi:hypothetical protein